MSPSRPFLLAYRTIKAELAGGTQPPGSQLKASAIALRLALSATPVREALSRLAGEGLVDDRRDQGYFVPFVLPRPLAELYTIQAHLSMLAVRADLSPALEGADPARSAADLVEELARRSGNTILLGLLRNLNDRLALARRAEAACVPGTYLETLRTAIGRSDRKALRQALEAYFEQCRRASEKIIRHIEAEQII